MITTDVRGVNLLLELHSHLLLSILVEMMDEKTINKHIDRIHDEMSIHYGDDCEYLIKSCRDAVSSLNKGK